LGGTLNAGSLRTRDLDRSRVVMSALRQWHSYFRWCSAPPRLFRKGWTFVTRH